MKVGPPVQPITAADLLCEDAELGPVPVRGNVVIERAEHERLLEIERRYQRLVANLGLAISIIR